jgi:hypothetical protein
MYIAPSTLQGFHPKCSFESISSFQKRYVRFGIGEPIISPILSGGDLGLSPPEGWKAGAYFLYLFVKG